MNKFIKVFAKSVFFLTILVLTACVDDISDSHSPDNVQVVPDLGEKVKVNIKISSIDDDIKDRTVLPEPEHEKLLNISLKGTLALSPISDETLGEWDAYSDISSSSVELYKGNWTLTLTAIHDGVEFTDTQTLTITNNTAKTVNFALAPASGVTNGGFDIKLYYKTDNGTPAVVKGGLYTSSGTETIALASLTPQSESGSYYVRFNRSVTGSDNVAQGTYRAKVIFYGDDACTVELNQFWQIVRIENGYTSSFSNQTKPIDLNPVSTITYDKNSGSYLTGESGVTKYSLYSADITLPKAAKSGTIFAGWQVSTDGGLTYSEEPITEIPHGSSGDKKLKALYLSPEVYVSSSGTATGTSNLDGFKADKAFASLQTCVDHINTVVTNLTDLNTGTEAVDISRLPWKVTVSGEVKGTTSISTLSATGLTITAKSSSSNDILNGNVGSTAVANGTVLSISLPSTCPVTIKTLTIKGGNTTTNGGGLNISSGSNVTLTDAVVTSNNASVSGGGISNSGSLTLNGSTLVRQNSAVSSGGGIRNEGSLCIYGNVLIGGSASTLGNSATGTSSNQGLGGGIYSTSGLYLGYSSTTETEAWTGTLGANSAKEGGGIYVYGGTFKMDSGTIGGSTSGANTATVNAGGIAIKGESEITGGTISYNTADTNGGGLYVYDAKVTISTVTISNNTATGSSASGGGIYNYNSSKALTITGASINGNQATVSGGGIYNWGNLYISGTTDIGGTSGNKTTSTSSGRGGGIFTTGYNCCLGYSAASTTSSWSGGIYQNSSVEGGGVYVDSGTFKMAYGYIGASSKANTATNGGGIYNKTAVTLEGGTISSNTAISAGGAIYANGNLTVKAMYIPAGAAEKNNDIYLVSDKTITLTGNLSSSHTSSSKMAITPSEWTRGKTVLSGASYIADNYGKIKTTDSDWSVISYGSSTSTVGKIDCTQLYVKSTGNDDTGRGTSSKPYLTIEKAVKQCWQETEYTINVVGTLTGAQKIPAAASGQGVASKITLQGTSIAATLDGGFTTASSSGTVLTIATAVPVTITSLNITGGKYSASTVYAAGGIAVTNQSNTGVTLGSGVKVYSNEGGGVYSKALLTIAGATIQENTAPNGGGVCISGGSLIMTSGTITQNNATSTGGGGVYFGGAVSSYFTMTGGTISKNTSARDGGGVYLSQGSFFMSGTAVIGDSTVTGPVDETSASNKAASGGGGIYATQDNTIYIGYTRKSDGTAEAVTSYSRGIYGNYTTGNGGGICAFEANLNIAKGNILGNTAVTYGGGCYFGRRAAYMSGGNIAKNQAIGADGDSSQGQGGGVYYFDCALYLSGDILIGGAGATGTSSAESASCSNYAKLKGGGICATKAYTAPSLYLGYSASGTESALNTGKGVCYNYSAGDGGGIYVEGTVTMKTGEIARNSGANGGGIYSTKDITMTGGKIHNNSATTTAITDNAGGGGVCVKSASLDMSGGSIYENTSSNNGGGVMLDSGNLYMTGTAVIGDDSFNEAASEYAMASNYAAKNGGGVYCTGDGLIHLGKNSSGTYAIVNKGIYFNFAEEDGGGIYYNGSKTLEINNGNIKYNGAKVDGAGIHSRGKTTITGGTFSYNSASGTNGRGGAIYSYYETAENFVVSNATISHNTAKWSGGGIHVEEAGAITIAGTTNISSNSADENGGGIGISEGEGLIIIDEEVVIDSNTTPKQGGGIFGTGKLTIGTSSGTFTGSITNNTAEEGGGIYWTSTGTKQFDFYSGTISENSATKNGGGIYCYSGALGLYGGTISKNTAATYGGAIFAEWEVLFSLSGGITIPCGPDATNDIYVDGYSATKFNIQDLLTAPNSVALLTYPNPGPGTSDLSSGLEVMTTSTLSGENFAAQTAKFGVRQNRNTMQLALIQGTGTNKQKAYLKSDTSFRPITGTTQTAISGSNVFVTGRSVDIKNMIVSDHECTQKEYKLYCYYAHSGSPGYKIPTSSTGLGDDYPANFTSWYDAIIYCNLRSMAEGLTPVYSASGETNPAKWPTSYGVVTGTGDNAGKFCGPYDTTDIWKQITFNTAANGWRLPTEAEWEYLARGGANNKYSGSDDYSLYAWTSENAEGTTHPVTKKKKNGYNLYDMSGNVYEYVWDWYGGDITATTDPEGVGQLNAISGYLNHIGPVVRGGSYDYEADPNATVSDRTVCNTPEMRWANAGFRIVRNK